MSLPADGFDGFGPCEFTENLEILRQIEFFSGFPIERLKVMAYLCTREEFGPGDLLFSSNEDDGQAFFIMSGEVALIYDENGGTREVQRFGPGEFLGALSLLGSMRRLFSLRSEARTTCLVMEREKFAKALEQFPDLVPRLLKAVSHRIQSWEKRQLFDKSTSGGNLALKAGISVL